MRRLLVAAALLLSAAALAPGVALAQGVLVPTDRAIEPLSLRYHRVNVAMENGTAVTKVEQVFHNHTPRPLEATFLMPMPEQAAILEFAMWMNGERVEGKVLDREQARAVYEGIVRRMRDPGLIEWAGHSLFQARIFPIPANGDQKIEISWSQILPVEAGVYRYIYPLKTTERAIRTLEDFTVQVALHSKTPIRNIYSPTHRIYAKKTDDHTATVGFEEEGALLQKDFELLYSVSEKDIGLNLLTYRPSRGEAGYFLLMAAPKATWDESEIIGKAVTFVIDTSGSMAEQDKISRAKAALRHCVERLNDQDTFNVIRFSSDVEAFRPRLVSAGAERQAALEFIETLEPAGGTAIHDALAKALQTSGGDAPIIVFITDGRPTVGETETQKIVEAVAAANGKHARIFTFGVGSTVNTKLLDQLAAQHGGFATYVKPDAEIEEKITSFYNKMAHPVLSQLTLEIPGVRTYAMLPTRVPDLFRGDQLLVLGRYRGDGDSLVRLTGRVGSDARTYDYEGTFPAESKEHDFIAQLWASRQVGFLLEQVSLHGETPERVEEVKQLALQYGIVTPYTSYLAVEPGMGPQPVVRGPFRPTATATPTGGGGLRGAPDPFLDAEAPAMPAAAGKAAPRGWDRARGETERTVLQTKKGLEEETGDVAVETSKAIRELKEDEVAAPKDTRVRYLGGKVFRWDSGWVDQEWKAELPTLKVKYLSDAYFALLKELPQLKQWLSLGARVTVVVKGTALVISAEGQETLSASELGKLK
jgi:Ca-activated chloride channel family protein